MGDSVWIFNWFHPIFVESLFGIKFGQHEERDCQKGGERPKYPKGTD